jgi:hypothetical protein
MSSSYRRPAIVAPPEGFALIEAIDAEVGGTLQILRACHQRIASECVTGRLHDAE